MFFDYKKSLTMDTSITQNVPCPSETDSLSLFSF